MNAKTKTTLVRQLVTASGTRAAIIIAKGTVDGVQGQPTVVAVVGNPLDLYHDMLKDDPNVLPTATAIVQLGLALAAATPERFLKPGTAVYDALVADKLANEAAHAPALKVVKNDAVN